MDDCGFANRLCLLESANRTSKQARKSHSDKRKNTAGNVLLLALLEDPMPTPEFCSGRRRGVP